MGGIDFRYPARFEKPTPLRCQLADPRVPVGESGSRALNPKSMRLPSSKGEVEAAAEHSKIILRPVDHAEAQVVS